MGAKVNMTSEKMLLASSKDNIVIRKFIAGIPGGHSLDMSGYPEDLECIQAGHVVIRSTEDETLYKPMPVSGKAYQELPHNFEYVGVVRNTMPADDARVGIMYAGEVNDKACPFPVDTIKAAMKTALPSLTFAHD